MVALFGHDEPLNGEHTSLEPPGPPPTQQNCVAVLHEVEPHATWPGSQARPPSGRSHDEDGVPPSEVGSPWLASLDASPESLGGPASDGALEASSLADGIASSPPLDPRPWTPRPPLEAP
jgi:hypothetical protein